MINTETQISITLLSNNRDNLVGQLTNIAPNKVEAVAFPNLVAVCIGWMRNPITQSFEEIPISWLRWVRATPRGPNCPLFVTIC